MLTVSICLEVALEIFHGCPFQKGPWERDFWRRTNARPCPGGVTSRVLKTRVCETKMQGNDILVF